MILIWGFRYVEYMYEIILWNLFSSLHFYTSPTSKDGWCPHAYLTAWKAVTPIHLLADVIEGIKVNMRMVT